MHAKYRSVPRTPPEQASPTNVGKLSFRLLPPVSNVHSSFKTAAVNIQSKQSATKMCTFFFNSGKIYLLVFILKFTVVKNFNRNIKIGLTAV